VGYTTNPDPADPAKTVTRRLRKSVYAASKKALLDEIAKARIESGQGYLDGADMLLGDWFTLHLGTVKATRRRKTHESYEYVVEKHLRPVLGHTKLSDVKPNTMWYLQAQLKDVKPVAKWYACIVFKIFVRAAAAKQLIPHNPFADIRLEKPAMRKWKFWSVEQAQAFFSATLEDDLHAFYVLGVTCGLRHAELLALKVSDFDFAAGTLRVSKQLAEVKVKDPTGLKKWNLQYSLEAVKTKASDAEIVVPEATLKVIKAHIAKRLTGRDGFLFMTSAGTHFSQSNVRRAFNGAITKAGVPKIRVHDLRHTCATLLGEAGKEIKDIQFLLRHANFAITANTYMHVTKKMAQGVADAMDGIFAGGAK
jgi:integrase